MVDISHCDTVDQVYEEIRKGYLSDEYLAGVSYSLSLGEKEEQEEGDPLSRFWPSEEDLGLIHRQTGTSFFTGKGDVWVFPLRITSTAYDIEGERLSLQGVSDAVSLMVGGAGIKDHEMKVDNTVGRVYKAIQDGKDAVGYFYTPLKDVAWKIATGLYQKVSAGFFAPIVNTLCDTCTSQKGIKTSIGDKTCAHTCPRLASAGIKKGGKGTTVTIDRLSRWKEFSFVVLGKNPEAEALQSRKGIDGSETTPLDTIEHNGITIKDNTSPMAEMNEQDPKGQEDQAGAPVIDLSPVTGALETLPSQVAEAVKGILPEQPAQVDLSALEGKLEALGEVIKGLTPAEIDLTGVLEAQKGQSEVLTSLTGKLEDLAGKVEALTNLVTAASTVSVNSLKEVILEQESRKAVVKEEKLTPQNWFRGLFVEDEVQK
jgi:hypothetical protein